MLKLLYRNSRFAEVSLISDVVEAIHELPLRTRTHLYFIHLRNAILYSENLKEITLAIEY